MDFQFCLTVVISAVLATFPFGESQFFPLPPMPAMPQAPQAPFAPQSPLGPQPSGAGPAQQPLPSQPAAGLPSRFPSGFPSFSSFNFTNTSSFASDSKSSSFSSKDISSKISKVGDSGKTLEKSFNAMEFAENKTADASALADKMDLNTFKNATTDVENKVKTADGSQTQHDIKNAASETSASEIIKDADGQQTTDVES